VTTTALYRGQVVHARHRPVHHRFRYGVYMWLVDLERPPQVPRLLRPFAQIRSRDHLGDPGRTIRENVDAFLAGHGIDLEGGKVLMLANARTLGHVFNPLTVHWCHGPDGDIRCIVAEVHNTYGERHCYLLQPGDRGRAQTEKAFYVSPFLTVDGSYRMTFQPPGERLSVQMELVQEGERVFQASLTGRRMPFTTRSLLRMSLRYPFMTARVSLLIRWHGLRLWLRRVPRVRRPRHTPQRGVG